MNTFRIEEEYVEGVKMWQPRHATLERLVRLLPDGFQSVGPAMISIGQVPSDHRYFNGLPLKWQISRVHHPTRGGGVYYLEAWVWKIDRHGRAVFGSIGAPIKEMISRRKIWHSTAPPTGQVMHQARAHQSTTVVLAVQVPVGGVVHPHRPQPPTRSPPTRSPPTRSPPTRSPPTRSPPTHRPAGGAAQAMHGHYQPAHHPPYPERVIAQKGDYEVVEQTVGHLVEEYEVDQFGHQHLVNQWVEYY